jgi:hypothetical protein
MRTRYYSDRIAIRIAERCMIDLGRGFAALAVGMLLCACAAGPSPNFEAGNWHPTKQTLRGTGVDRSARKASVVEQAQQACAKEALKPNITFVLEDANAVQIEFYCEGPRASSHLTKHIETLERGINGLSEAR